MTNSMVRFLLGVQPLKRIYEQGLVSSDVLLLFSLCLHFRRFVILGTAVKERVSKDASLSLANFSLHTSLPDERSFPFL